MRRVKKVLITGGDGLLAKEVAGYFGRNKNFKVIPLGKRDLDITNYKKVLSVFKKAKPDIVVNCAAMINVDSCEENPRDAFLVNGLGAGNIARALRLLKHNQSVLVQISTSDVFGARKKFFVESDQPQPVNVYGWSKFFGEKIIELETKLVKCRFFIIRLGWFYGPWRQTFVDKMLDALREGREIDVIADQYNIPVSANEVGKTIEALATGQKFSSGIYHIGIRQKEEPSRFDIAMEIARMYGIKNPKFKRVYRKDIFKAPRPRSAILINTKLPSSFNWRNSLREFLYKQYGKP